VTVAALCPPSWTIRLIDRAFDDLNDADLEWADLVMVSAMHAQRVDARAVLHRARSAGRRTIVGGPWASSEPERLLPCTITSSWVKSKRCSRRLPLLSKTAPRAALPGDR